ncbi:MAG: cation:dicarboxylase symporter family transporter [Bdellovibrionaceae bacterium]|nr:cation:dicarboxylase symporter family transporter [Pseudobdellovibrionaceae bacterium]
MGTKNSFFAKTNNLTFWIFLFLILGFLAGHYLPEFSKELKPLRTLFLHGIKCIIAPLIFSSIVCGICSASNMKSLGKIGLKAIIWFEIATTIALVVGLFFVNFFEPGKGVNLVPHGTSLDAVAPKTQMTFAGFVEHLLPSNFVEAVAKGDVLQIVIFSIIFGAATLMAGDKGKPVVAFCESLNQVMFKFTDIVMKMAPIGVGAAMAAAIGEHGLGVLIPMSKLVLVLYLALVVFVLITLVPALKWSRIKLVPFFTEMRPRLALAFATTSSESAYPDTLKSLTRMGVPERVSSFVLPLGYSFNLDGSTLYLAMTSVFVAQAANIELSLGTQVSMMLLLMLTTKGVAAVPRASLVVLSGALVTFGLPLEAIPLILGVDEFMDMARTTVNLLGNAVATVFVSRWENEPLAPEFQEPG